MKRGSEIKRTQEVSEFQKFRPKIGDCYPGGNYIVQFPIVWYISVRPQRIAGESWPHYTVLQWCGNNTLCAWTIWEGHAQPIAIASPDHPWAILSKDKE